MASMNIISVAALRRTMPGPRPKTVASHSDPKIASKRRQTERDRIVAAHHFGDPRKTPSEATEASDRVAPLDRGPMRYSRILNSSTPFPSASELSSTITPVFVRCWFLTSAQRPEHYR
jgi:hypothetical protein